MNKEDFISTLPQAEQKALAVCGIYKAQQLQNISLDTLLADMSQAAEFFPEEIRALSQTRLAEIYRQAGTIVTTSPEPQAPAPITTEERIDVTPTEFERTLPPLVRKHGSRHHTAEKPQTDTIDITQTKAGKRGVDPVAKGNAICNTHPFRTLFSALMQLWLFTSFILFLVLSTRLLLGFNNGVDLYMLLIILGSGLLPYMFYTRKTKCPVCNVPMFSLQSYARNKHAHHIPLLGYSVATALHAIFFFWFRCPACGTSQKLFKRKRH
ncbi:MAG: hypothetical protein IJB64_06750 [Akkermansia sp.]|nr:hypothetical protein [Akkermansia sp.]